MLLRHCQTKEADEQTCIPLRPPRHISTPRAPWKGAIFQWVRIPPGKLSLQPVVIGAAVEVTKRLKPSV
jgi:hypothetical protein